MNKKDKFITFILNILMILIASVTIYFCLDVFGIIQVPQKYSIASLFYSQINVIATGGEIITNEIIPKNNVPNQKNNNTNVDEDTSSSLDNFVNPLISVQEYNSNNNNSIKVNEKSFYYDQLDEYGKIIYEKLYQNIDRLKTGTYTAEFDTTFDELLHQENGKDVLNSAFQLAINSLTFDNPDLFYIDITKINLITETTTRPFSTVYRVSIGGNGKSYLSDDFLNIEDANNAIDKVEQAKNNIINMARENTDNVIDQIKKVHDYLIDTIEYDSSDGRNVYNVYGSLINGKAVCEGYARAFKDILDEMGIPCIIVCGVGTNRSGTTESHAWNYVKINDNWYAVDVTWDDPVISGYGKLTDNIRYKYFLVGSDVFFKDHVEDGNIVEEYYFKYPEISKENY